MWQTHAIVTFSWNLWTSGVRGPFYTDLHLKKTVAPFLFALIKHISDCLLQKTSVPY